MRVVYIFPGRERHASVREELQVLCDEWEMFLEMTEVDLLRGEDVLDDATWDPILARGKAGDFDYALVTPPCNTHCRGLHSGRPGPRPLRDAEHPLGLPWLYGRTLDKVKLANRVIERAKIFIKECHASPASTKIFTEFPEDLGARTIRGSTVRPASLWQDPDWRSMLEDLGATSAAHHTCQWGAPVLKPARTASDIKDHEMIGYPGWPTFDDKGFYLGPLPKDCGHDGGHPPMQGKKSDGSFHSGTFASYRPSMNTFIARITFNDFSGLHHPSETSGSGEPEMVKSEGRGIPHRSGPHDRTVKKVVLVSRFHTAEFKNIFKADVDTSEDDSDGEPRLKWGAGNLGLGQPMQVKSAGKRRPFADGCGLASPGRWAPENRKTDMASVALAIKANVMKFILENGTSRKCSTNLRLTSPRLNHQKTWTSQWKTRTYRSSARSPSRQ